MEGFILIIVLALVTLGSRWIITGNLAVPLVPGTATPVAVFPTPFPDPPTFPATWTPTPTSTPSPVPSPTPTAISTPTAGPSPHPPDRLPSTPIIVTEAISTPQPLPVPPPMPLLEQPEGVLNILLLGSDQSSTEKSVGRTDVILIASIDPARPSVSLLSIPRDYYAWIPGHGFNKINTAYSHGVSGEYPGGGAGLMKATIEYNFGVRIHYYALVGFDGFVKIVDALGGVDVAVECPLSDTFPDPNSPTGQTDVDWTPGVYHLDGQHALWYVRSRWSTTDFDRNRRQQQVLRGMYRQILALDVLPKIPQVWGVLNETMTTDLGLEEVVYLASIGSELDMANVKSSFVGREVVQSWTAPNGGYVLVPYYEVLGPFIAEALAPPATARVQQRPFRVEVWNGTGQDGLGYVAAERLRWEGFEVLSVVPAQGNYPRTQIWDFTTTAKGSSLPLLMSLFRRYGGDVVVQPTEGRVADFRIVLGADYDPCWATKIRRGSKEIPTPTPIPTPLPTPVP